MARMPRVVVPGLALHVVQRGNNRQAVFFAEEDYRFYLMTLERTVCESGCAIHAYVLMTNHVHLLLTPSSKEAPSQLMQGVGRRYVRYINNTYQRTGTLWEGRYKSALIDSDRHLLACSRYIELNPVRAGMVSRPDEYHWSSYRTNAQGKQSPLVSPHQLYTALGTSPAARQGAYRALFADHTGSANTKAIREGTDLGLIGGDRFRAEIETALQRRVRKSAHGGDRRSKRFSRGQSVSRGQST